MSNNRMKPKSKNALLSDIYDCFDRFCAEEEMYGCHNCKYREKKPCRCVELYVVDLMLKKNGRKTNKERQLTTNLTNKFEEYCDKEMCQHCKYSEAKEQDEDCCIILFVKELICKG